MKITRHQLRRIIREAIAPGPTGFSLQDIALGIVKDNPGMAGLDIVDTVQYQPAFKGTSQSEILNALDPMLEDGLLFFDEEEDAWFTSQEDLLAYREGGVWSDEQDYEAGFMS